MVLEIFVLAAIAVFAYVIFLGFKFSNFRSKLMNEFGRRGVDYHVADKIYFLMRDDINRWHNDGVPDPQIVERCLQIIDPQKEANSAVLGAQLSSYDDGYRPNLDAKLEAPSKVDNTDALVEFVSGVLSIQQFMIRGGDDMLPEKAFDDWSLGYVAGAADAVLQKNGYEPDAKGMALMTSIFVEVFGKEAGPSLFGKFMELQEQGEPEVEKGMLLGGREIFKWMADSSKTPKGWASHVLGL